MRQIVTTAVAGLVLVFGSAVRLEAQAVADGAATAPGTATTRPTIATQTRVMTAPTAVSTPTVLILLFRNIGQPGQHDWIATSMQQMLVADLRSKTLLPVLAPGRSRPVSADDPEGAAAVGRAEHAQAVLFGSYQVSGSEVRATGQLVDASTGRVLGSLRADGTLEHLVSMEDDMGDQLRILLRRNSPLGLEQTVADLYPGPAPAGSGSQVYGGASPPPSPASAAAAYDAGLHYTPPDYYYIPPTYVSPPPYGLAGYGAYEPYGRYPAGGYYPSRYEYDPYLFYDPYILFRFRFFRGGGLNPNFETRRDHGGHGDRHGP